MKPQALSVDEVLRKITAHVSFLVAREEKDVSADKPLHLLGLDSMGFVDLLVFIEKQFGLSLMGSGLTQEDFRSLSFLAQRIVQAAQK
jgi:acyl carrier protein